MAEIFTAEVTDLKDLAPGAKAVIQQGILGPGMKRLQMQRESALMDLRNSGRLKAATVINFNPVSLKVEDGNVRWRIPAATDKMKKGLKVEHGGRTFEAAFMTIREPAFVAWIRDVHKPSDEGENPSAEYDPKFILPIELANQYRIQYTSPQFTPMGGVLVVEGDIHSFISKREMSKTIRIPESARLPDGTRSYFTKEVDTMRELASTLDMQKIFCTFMIQQGDEYNQDEQNRKNITPVHRLWLQYALDMGWKQNASPWLNSQMDSEEACKGCGKGKTRSDAFFCQCGRPYQPYAAFMAGENVPESYLFALKGKELDDVLSELGRREALKARFAKLNEAPPTKQEKTKDL